MRDSEQLKLFGNVLEFPKNNKVLKDKLDIAIRILEMSVEQGYDFSISIPKESACELFGDECHGRFKNVVVIASSSDFINKIMYEKKSVHLIPYE